MCLGDFEGLMMVNTTATMVSMDYCIPMSSRSLLNVDGFHSRFSEVVADDDGLRRRVESLPLVVARVPPFRRA